MGLKEKFIKGDTAMGRLGRWIDGLTDEAKDRIVRGQNWGLAYLNLRGRKCLLGHAADAEQTRWLTLRKLVQSGGSADTEVLEAAEMYRITHNGETAGDRFDQLSSRFGIERIVRCVKLRAGASVEECSVSVENPVRVEEANFV